VDPFAVFFIAIILASILYQFYSPRRGINPDEPSAPEVVNDDLAIFNPFGDQSLFSYYTFKIYAYTIAYRFLAGGLILLCTNETDRCGTCTMPGQKAMIVINGEITVDRIPVKSYLFI
jgi:hypothetical protein